jgi:hypothetical protein
MRDKEKTRVYNHNNIETRSLFQKSKRKKVREEIISLLGGKCIICGYSGLALQIDHVNGKGTEERKILGKGVKECNLKYLLFVLDKIKNGSKDYQLLCSNHNLEKYFKGLYKV